MIVGLGYRPSTCLLTYSSYLLLFPTSTPNSVPPPAIIASSSNTKCGEESLVVVHVLRIWVSALSGAPLSCPGPVWDW